MASNRYHGDRSCFLLGGWDYAEVAITTDVDRLPEHDLGFRAEEEARARRLLTDNVVVSLPNQPVRLPENPKRDLLAGDREARLVYGYEGLSRSALTRRSTTSAGERRGNGNPGECFRSITRWLVKHNYSDDEIAAVTGRQYSTAPRKAVVTVHRCGSSTPGVGHL